ncbi:MAG TPA: methyltransferase domain-containing protein [Chloroflexia bacterium]|nr:methyltransferase domain-containing protein [Chloroflexia bacterium]
MEQGKPKQGALIQTFGGAKPGTWGVEPSEGVAAAAPFLVPGKALDLGCGDGRNTLFLAHKGLHVTAVDIVPEAITNLNRYATRANLQAQIEGVVADIEGYEIDGPFEDIVSVFTLHFLPADAFPVVLDRITAATSIGGINVIEDFTRSGPLYHPGVQGHFLQSGELRRLYEDRGWQVLYYDEGTATTRATDAQGNRIKQGSATIVAKRRES